VPGEVAGEHADQHVGFDAFFQAVEHRAQVQVVGLDVAEVPLHVPEVSVGGDHGGGGELAGGDGGAQHVEPVQGRFGGDLVLPAPHGQAVIGDGDLECLAVFYLLITLPTATPIGPAPASLPAWTRAMIGASSFSVAASSSSRLRVRSAARTGLRQATSRSPG
jgi:hypothetical protein